MAAFIGGQQQQLIMCVPGFGGTGKSYLIEAVTCYFAETARNEKLCKLSPAAMFASLLEGNTIHSFLVYLRNNQRQKMPTKPGSLHVEND